MKKYEKILLIFVICLIGLGILAFLNREMGQVASTPRPEWVTIDDTPGHHVKLNIFSITKIQEETVDKNIRINSPALIKRNIYSAWVKIYPSADDETRKLLEQSGKKVEFIMIRVFLDLANHETCATEDVVYFSTGSSINMPQYPEWHGIIPGTDGEKIFETVVKYK